MDKSIFFFIEPFPNDGMVAQCSYKEFQKKNAELMCEFSIFEYFFHDRAWQLYNY